MANYVIDHAFIPGKKEALSLLIKDNKIYSIRPSFKQDKCIRMDFSPFIMTPTNAMISFTNIDNLTFSEQKQLFLEQYIKKGCTTIISIFRANYEYEWSNQLKRAKSGMYNCPIDYSFGILVPQKKMNQNLARFCKKEKIPIIYFHYTDVQALSSFPWGWFREALFPYNCCVMPYITGKTPKEENWMIKEWNKRSKIEKIPTIDEFIKENTPLSHNALTKLGLYPIKGTLQQGSELSYNLYEKSLLSSGLDDKDLFYFHNEEIIITVHNGEVIRAGDNTFFYSGNGNELMIKRPAFYVSNI